MKLAEDLFFFFFFFFLLVTFLTPLKFVGSTKMEISTGKKCISCRGKKYSSYASGFTYQFLSACFRNLTNAINSAINSTYNYQAFTMCNVWESVVSEA